MSSLPNLVVDIQIQSVIMYYAPVAQLDRATVF